MLAEMQSAMHNMVNNQLQNDFQLTSLSSSSPPPPPPPPSSSSPPRLGVTLAPLPQAPPLPMTPSSPLRPAPAMSSSLASPPTQCQRAPPPLDMLTSLSSSSTPPPPLSPGVDSTISAIARAHRETFLYAHDKLTNPNTLMPRNHQHPYHQQAHLKVEMNDWPSNQCPNGYHTNGLNGIYHNNNNLDSRNMAPNHHGNNSHSNLPGGQVHSKHAQQGPNCPMKNHTNIVLVRTKSINMPIYIQL